MEIISVAYIINNGKVLALKRSDIKKSNPGKWHVLSGAVEDGETPLDCVLREINEELGDDLCVDLVEESKYIDKQEERSWETHLFVFEYKGGNILLNRENSAYLWVSKEELLSMDVITSISEDLKYLKF